MEFNFLFLIIIVLLIPIFLVYDFKSKKKINLNNKREKLEKLREYIHLDSEGNFVPQDRVIYVNDELKTSAFLTLGLVAGAGGGISNSYYNLHKTFQDNEEFTDIMKDRYNSKFLNANKDQWLETLSELNRSESMHNNYVNNFTGYKAEQIAIQTLENLGYEVKAFEARNHPDDDLSVIALDGESYNVSVKSSNSVDYLKNAVNNHPNSTHYIINEELYAKIQNSPEIIKWFSERDIILIDGKFNNKELRETASRSIEAFNGMEESILEELGKGAMEHFFEGMPIAGLVLFGFKMKKNKQKFEKGEQSSHEYKINNVSDGVGVAGRTTAVIIAGGKLGTVAGVWFGPPGMAVGGLVGGLTAAFGVGQLITISKNKMKWGEINTIQKIVSNHYSDELFGPIEKTWLLNNVLKMQESENLLKEYSIRVEQYKNELDENSSIMPSLEAVVFEQTKYDLEKYIQFKDQMLEQLLQNLRSEFENLYEDLKNEKKKREYSFISQRLIGEWVLKQASENGFPIKFELHEKFNSYNIKTKYYPNYPVKFPFDPVSNLSALGLTIQLEILESLLD